MSSKMSTLVSVYRQSYIVFSGVMYQVQICHVFRKYYVAS